MSISTAYHDCRGFAESISLRQRLLVTCRLPRDHNQNVQVGFFLTDAKVRPIVPPLHMPLVAEASPLLAGVLRLHAGIHADDRAACQSRCSVSAHRLAVAESESPNELCNNAPAS